MSQDAYITPPWCVKRLLEKWRPPSGIWLDPCAARGELLTTVHQMRPENSYGAIEIRQSCETALAALKGKVIEGYAIADFLQAKIEDKSVDVIVTNPPYSLTNEFIRECVRVAKRSALLLRVNAFRGDGREQMIRELNPGLFLLPDRPSYTGWGQDSTEYAWFVFGDPEVSGRWFMLDSTPDEERFAWNEYARTVYPKPVKKEKAA